MINFFNKKIYFKSYQIYFIGLFILICNFAFLFNERYLEWAYYTCFQCINYDLLRHDFFKSIFYLHSQPPLWNFIIGLGYKFSSIFNNPLIFQGFLNFKNISHLPLNAQSTATIFFSVALFLAPIQGLLIYRILTKFVNNLLSLFFLIIYFLLPFLVYQILLGSWEFYFSFFLIILIYFFYETNSTLKKTIFFRNILILTFSLIFLLLLRSTISIFFLIILIFLCLFKFDKKIVLKFIMLPVILVYFILCLKNFFIIKKFKFETQSIFHLSHSYGPFLIKDKKYYDNLNHNEKLLVKNFNLGLLHGGAGFFEDIGFKKISDNKFLNDGNHTSLSEASSSYQKLLINTIFNKGLDELIFFAYYSTKNYFLTDNLAEGLNIRWYRKIDWDYIDLFSNKISIQNIFIFLFIFNILFKIINFKSLKDNDYLKNLLFIDILFIYLIIVTGTISPAGNPRYRIASEPIYFIYFILSVSFIYSCLKNFYKKKNTIIIGSVALFFVCSLNYLVNIDLKNSDIIKDNLKKNSIEINNKLFGDKIEKIIIDSVEFSLVKRGDFNYANDQRYYFTSSNKVYVDNFFISTTKIQLQNYLNFLKSINYEKHLPIWWNRNLSESDNIKEFYKYYSLTETNNLLYPIAGINFHDAEAFSNWFSKKNNLIFDIPSDHEWSKAQYYLTVQNNNQNTITNFLGKNERFNDDFVKLVDFQDNQKKVNQWRGNLWEWTRPFNNILYKINNRVQYSLNISYFDLMNDNNSKFIVNREFAYLRGGSYTTTSVGKEINSAKLILGKDISDEDFTFRLVIR